MPDDRRYKGGPTVEGLAELCRYAAIGEIQQLMAEINPPDLSAMELIAMLTVLRSAHDRNEAEQTPPPVLELVRSGRRARR
jgi:hypothetical protein